MPKVKATVSAAVLAMFATSLLLPAGGSLAAEDSAAAADKPKITFNSPDDVVVAIVNGEPVTKKELSEAIWQRYAIPTLTDLIDKLAVRQAATEAGVTVTEQDVDEKVNEFMDRLPPGMTMDQFLEQWNLDVETLRNELRPNIYIEKAAAQNIQVTEQDLAGYVKARHILIQTRGNTPEDRAQSEEDARTRLEELAERIRKGEVSFEDAAKETTEDVATRESGGDLGFFKRGIMVPEFDAAAFELKVGDVSEPVKTNYGYHLIQVTALGKDASPEDKAELTNRIREERLRPEMAAWLMRVKQDANVERMLGEQPQPPAPPANEVPSNGDESGATNGADGMNAETPPPPPPPPAN